MTGRPTVQIFDAESGFTYIFDGRLNLCSACGSEAYIREWNGIGDVICTNVLCVNHSTYTRERGYQAHYSGKSKTKKRDAITIWNAHNGGEDNS